jgi:uncharacterized protein (DUF1778 family)
MAIKLNHEESVRFAKALTERREPTEAFKQAAKLYRETVKIDIKEKNHGQGSIVSKGA